METVFKQVCDHLVVDSGGFIKNVPLHEYGKQVLTLFDVVDEIRDKDTKQRIKALPYTIHFREPASEALKIVTEFSRKTGDYGNLSLTDLKVLALVYTLEAQLVGTSHLKQEPTLQRTLNFSQPGGLSATAAAKEDSQMPGFVGTNKSDSCPELGSSDGEEAGSCDEDDQEDGWITPQNVNKKRLAMNCLVKDDECVKVACLTTDFAMQNVLKQMGLNVVSTDGYLIHETKTWIKRCYACFKTTPDVTKQFCPKCGNRTLKRVSVTLNADGSQQIHLSGRVQVISKKGKRFSLPAPVGGKHAINPVLCEDQPQPQQRLSQVARKKTDALSPDYVARSSPFALKDVTSKSAMMSIGRGCHKHWMQKNPNAASKNTGNKKRSC